MATSEPVLGADTTGDITPAGGPPKKSSRTRLIWLRLKSTPRFWIGATVVGLIILWAIFGTLFYPYSYDDQDLLNTNMGPTNLHWFGTNSIGGDIYAQTVVGLRKSLAIGLIAGPTATLIAAFVGSFAGYLGGKYEIVIAWFINLLLVIPVFFILIVVSPLFKSKAWIGITFFVAIFSWMVMAQVIRSQTKSLRNQEFVKAARFMGVSTPKIIRRHIIPNVASLLIINATIGVAYAILNETALSFFGFGIQPPEVSLGTLLSAGQAAAVTRPWLFVFPAGVLIILLFAVGLVGDALRDAVDPTSGATRD